jgi:hypothetical protein
MSNVDQYMYLVPQRDAQGTVSWMWIYNGDSGTSKIPPIVAAKGSGQNDITFAIVDPQNAIKFAGYDGPNTAAAISIGEKTNPATKPTTIATGGEFKSVNLVDGTHLKLDDKNSKEKDFVYALNFVDSANGNLKVTGIDPEIRNGDGSTVFQSAATYVGVALIGAMLTLMVVRFVLGWRAVR